jgi:hypothetical protein
MQVFQQFRGALGSHAQVADNQHGPLVADQLQRSGYRTAIDLTSSQSLFLSLTTMPGANNRTKSRRILQENFGNLLGIV